MCLPRLCILHAGGMLQEMYDMAGTMSVYAEIVDIASASVCIYIHLCICMYIYSVCIYIHLCMYIYSVCICI